MLQSFRSKIKSVVVAVLVFLLIASFALWGVEHIASDVVSSNSEVASVNGKAIYSSELFDRVRRDSAQFERALGRELEVEELYNFGIIGRASDALITQLAVNDMAWQIGLEAGDDLAKRSIVQTQPFLDDSGKFSPDRFRAALRRAGFSETSYLDLLKSEIKRDLVVASALHIPQSPTEIVNIFVRDTNERRSASSLKIDRGRLPKPVLTPEELEKWYNANLDAYSSPERRDVTAIVLTQTSVQVSDEELLEVYNTLSFETPETRNVEIALLRDESSAQALLGRIALASNESPLQLIAESLTPLSVTHLPELKREDGVPQITDAAFATTQIGGFGPIQTPFGWHVGRLNAIVPKRSHNFEESRKKVLEAWWEERGADHLFELGNRLDDMLAGGATLEEASVELGLEVVTLKGVDVSGDIAESSSSNIEHDTLTRFKADIAQASFNQSVGETSALIELDQGGVVVRTNQIIPAMPLPFVEVREQVGQDLQAERKAEMAQGLAVQIIANVKSGDSLKTVYESYNEATQTALTFEVSKPENRKGWVEKLSPEAAQTVFNLTTENTVGRMSDADSETIYYLKSVSHPNVSVKNQEDEANKVRDEWAASFLASMLASIRKTAHVDVDTRVVSALFPIASESQ